MLIRQPKHHLSIRRRQHIIPRIPLTHRRPPPTRQPRNRSQHFLPLARRPAHDRSLRIPHHRVSVRRRGTNQVAPIGAEGDVTLAGGHGVCDGCTGRCAQGFEGGVGVWGAGAEGFEGAFEGVEEDVALRVVAADEEPFAVVGEFEFRP